MLLQAASLCALPLAIGLAFALPLGVRLWARRPNRLSDDRLIAAPVADPTDRPVLADSPSVVSWRILPDPSWGMWPVPGDLLIAESALRPVARRRPWPLAP